MRQQGRRLATPWSRPDVCGRPFVRRCGGRSPPFIRARCGGVWGVDVYGIHVCAQRWGSPYSVSPRFANFPCVSCLRCLGWCL